MDGPRLYFQVSLVMPYVSPCSVSMAFPAFSCVCLLLMLILLVLFYGTNRGSYMSAHVLLNLLDELGKRDKMRGLPSILSLFCNEFDKFNNTRARMLDSIYHMALRSL